MLIRLDKRVHNSISEKKLLNIIGNMRNVAGGLRNPSFGDKFLLKPAIKCE